MRTALVLSIIMSLAVALLAPVACAKPTPAPAQPPATEPAPAPTPTPTPTPELAEFEVVSLDIAPPEAIAGEAISITALVKNIGGSEGTYAATLTVDGVAVETKEVMITPGSSEVVTFPLMKEAPGTYEVSIGELSSSLIIRERLELKHDDGTSDGFWAIGGSNHGHAVYFSPPSTPFVINELKIYGSLYGTDYDKRKFQMKILTEDFTLLFRSLESHTRFSHEPTWVTVAIPDIVVIDNFYIFISTNSPPTGGINIHYDSSVHNIHSEVIEGCRPANWYLITPKHKVNWMIRLIGKPAEEGTSPTSPSPKVSVSEELLETVNILDNPRKLSRWLLDNIEYESSYEEYKETGFDYIASPNETFSNGVGNCAEFTVFACYVLKHHGYDAIILSIQVESKPWKGHVVCVYESSGSLYTINVGRIEGPFKTYEDIALAHDKDWSQYRVFYSWMNFQESCMPDEVVDRE